MNILIISSSSSSRNASIVIEDLRKALELIDGVKVNILARRWDKYEPNVQTLDNTFKVKKQWLTKKARSALKKAGIIVDKLDKTNRDYNIRNYDQTKDFHSTKKILKKIKERPDAIFVLSMQNNFNFKNLSELSIYYNIPVFIRMADMAPMTGGCHYAWECKGYQNKCGNCPAYKSTNEKDQSRINWEFKKYYTDIAYLIPVAGSEQQYQQLLSSSLFEDKPKYKIINSINPDKYKPGDKLESRKILGLPPKKKILFFGAVSYNVRRKGFYELTAALQILANVIDNTIKENLLLVGAGKNLDFMNEIDLSSKSIGYLNHDQLIHAYRAADVFLSPSIEDSGPMMIRQAAMTGTPIVAFNIGNALDFVISGKTGYRAKLYDVNDFAGGIKSMLELKDAEYKKMCENCRNNALKIASPEVAKKQFENILLKHTKR
ncbi:MAG: glycosyltransferase [bacterium]